MRQKHLSAHNQKASFMVSPGPCTDTDNQSPVAQLVEHRAVTREVVSSTPAGPTLRVLK